MVISTTPEKLQQTADELGAAPDVQDIPFIYVSGVKIKLRNVEVIQTILEGSNSFILGHPVNGVFGVTTGLGGGQVVLGLTIDPIVTTLIKRSYTWDTTTDFERGKITNVDISQGFLQLGNVSVKNLLLEHKTK